MDKLLKNEMSFAAAEKMLEMPKEEQNKLLEETELGSKEYKKYLNALNQLERVLW